MQSFSPVVYLTIWSFVRRGSKLLSADGDGQIKCWSMSDHLVNSWESILSSSLDGDPIVALSWLHNGVKLALHVEMVRPADPVDPQEIREDGQP